MKETLRTGGEYGVAATAATCVFFWSGIPLFVATALSLGAPGPGVALGVLPGACLAVFGTIRVWNLARVPGSVASPMPFGAGEWCAIGLIGLGLAVLVRYGVGVNHKSTIAGLAVVVGVLLVARSIGRLERERRARSQLG